ncbi:hypothetical protein RI054_03g17260 [Pseudoscourfieldia marina]
MTRYEETEISNRTAEREGEDGRDKSQKHGDATNNNPNTNPRKPSSEAQWGRRGQRGQAVNNRGGGAVHIPHKGAHVEHVLGDVPVEQRCACPRGVTGFVSNLFGGGKGGAPTGDTCQIAK